MSVPHGKKGFRLSNEDFFYLEQWVALLVGLTCLIMSIWSAIHDCRAFPSAHTSGTREGVRLAFNGSLAIAVGLIGTALTRFSFRGKPSSSIDGPSPVQSENRLKRHRRNPADLKTLVRNREGSR